MNKRIILIVIISFFLLFFITGCWNRVEIDEKAIIAGAGIDRTQDKGSVKLTVQVVIPREVKAPVGGGGQGGEAKNAIWIVTSTGTSVFDAIRNFGLQSGRKGLWSHNKVLVIGEEAAKKGIDEIIDIFERDSEIRRRTWVLVARGDAKDIMEAKTEIEKIPAFNISNLVEASGVTSKVATTDLHKLFGMISSKTTCAFAPGIEAYEKEGDNKNKDKRLRLTDTAVFKNYKLKGWLNQYETRGLLWVLGKVKSGIIEVKCLLGGETPTSLEIIRASSKIKPEIKNDNITITVEINEEGNVGATPIPCADLSNPEDIKKIEKRKVEVIEKEINEVVKKAQEFNTDIFGFGDAVYRKYPKEWKELERQWDEIFPNLEVKVEVNAKIKRTGLITKSAKPE